ncbi:hypothetical protein LTR48_006694, partial [Friedmanniomyces endolithicus]
KLPVLSDALQRLGTSFVETARLRDNELRQSHEPIETAAKRRGLGTVTGMPWDRLYRLINNPYFTRLWVAQEVPCGRSHEVRYDRWRLSLRHIQDAANVSIVLNSELRATFGVPTIDFSDPSYDNEFTAATLLMAVAANAARTRLVLAPPGRKVSQYSTRKCSNPRDYIYAVVALFTPGVLAERYTVDYSLTVQEVFIRFASHCLRVLKDTTLLSVARSQMCCRDTAFMSEVASRAWTSYLPSWCPDWAGPDCLVEQLVTHEEATAGRVI